MTGVVNALISSGGDGIQRPIPVQNARVNGQQAGAGYTANIRFITNGQIQCFASGAGPFADGSSNGGTDWRLPNSPGFGSAYWIRLTRTGGTETVLNGTSLGVWAQLNLDKPYELGPFTVSSGQTRDMQCTAQIATDSGGANIIATGNCNFTIFGAY